MKYAFVNSDDVLVSWGYQEANGDDRRVDVPEDFDLEPGKWKLVGDEWVAYEAPPPVPTEEQMMAKRNSLLDYATQQINPLQDLVDIGESTPEDEALLLLWKKYRAAIGKTTSQPGWHLTVVWPVAPV